MENEEKKNENNKKDFCSCIDFRIFLISLLTAIVVVAGYHTARTCIRMYLKSKNPQQTAQCCKCGKFRRGEFAPGKPGFRRGEFVPGKPGLRHGKFAPGKPGFRHGKRFRKPAPGEPKPQCDAPKCDAPKAPKCDAPQKPAEKPVKTAPAAPEKKPADKPAAPAEKK